MKTGEFPMRAACDHYYYYYNLIIIASPPHHLPERNEPAMTLTASVVLGSAAKESNIFAAVGRSIGRGQWMRRGRNFSMCFFGHF